MTAAARLSMALALPTLSLIFWLYAGWQSEKLSKVEDKIETSQKSAQTASDLSIRLSDRLTTVETKQSEATISNEKFQAATLSPARSDVRFSRRAQQCRGGADCQRSTGGRRKAQPIAAGSLTHYQILYANFRRRHDIEEVEAF